MHKSSIGRRPTLTLLGCGRMGKALLKGWQEQKTFFDIICVDNKGEKAFVTKGDIKPKYIFEQLPKSSPTDILLIATKPQSIPDAIENIKSYITPDTIVWSIAAGVSVENFEKHFGTEQPIVRIMPNTPAAVGKGAFAAYANDSASHIKPVVENSFNALGRFVWVESDREIDIVTALSGGAPAYYYTFTKTMADIAHKIGLPKETADFLATESLIGSAALLENNPNPDLQKMINDVTSPGGTTAKAIEIFENSQFKSYLEHGIEAAFRRGRELSKKD